jgi:hypothetical protein
VAKRKREIRRVAFKLLLAFAASVGVAWAAGEPVQPKPVQAGIVAQPATARS